MAHEVVEAALKNGCRTATEGQQHTRFADQDLAPLLSSTVIDFKSSINTCLDYVWGLIEEINMLYGDAVLYTETFVNPPVASAPGEAAGHCDIAIYSAKARKLWVIDYKHGAGIVKAVEGNSQVSQYAAGFLFDPRGFVNPETIDVVELVIIQPRAFHKDGEIRSYPVTVGYVRDYLTYLDGVIADCQRPDAPLTPGDDQCGFCEAKENCPALQALALSTINSDFRQPGDVATNKIPDPKSIETQRLSYIKSMKPLIMKWFEACDEALKERILQGNPGHGYKAVEAHAKREYYSEIPEYERVRKVAALIGVQDWELYNVKMKPLTEVEEMMIDAFKARVGRGRKKAAAEDAKQLFAYFTIKQPSGAITIVDDSDARPAVNLAAKYYGDIPQITPPTTGRK